MSIKKIVIIGPESTGKSTLSEGLARTFDTEWVPEFARSYLENIGRDYNQDDLLQIAKGQINTEDELLEQASKYLICDTDLYVLKVWSEHKYAQCHPWIMEQIANRKYDAYLLTDIDMPWQYDELREHPQETMRQYFFDVYKDIVQNSGTPFTIISGCEQQRLKAATEFINKTFLSA